MKTVVLLSTCNGEAFVAAQVQSILDQDWPDLHLVIRDDGSHDDTRAVLQRLAQDRRVTVVHETNIGLPHAFFRLVGLCPRDAGMVMFADQDDIWLPGKIAAAAAGLARIDSGTPGLYCGRLRIVDARLTAVGLSPDWPQPPSFGNALIENVCTGCTAALNAAGFALLSAHRPVRGVIHHDWWLYLLVSAFGTVVFDAEPHILYRMHGGNAVGLPTGALDHFRRRIERWRAGRSLGLLIDQARAVEASAGGALTAPARDLLHAMLEVTASRGAAVRLSQNRQIHRQRRGDDIVWRASLLLCAVAPTRRSVSP